MKTHELKLLLIERAGEKIRQLHALVEHESLESLQWTEADDATLAEIQRIYAAMEAEMIERRDMMIARAEGRGPRLERESR